MLAREAGTPVFGFSFADPEDIPSPQLDHSTGIYIGEPWYPDDAGVKTLVIPYEPHVFTANITLAGPVGPRNTAKGMHVLCGHGGDNNGKWQMRNRRDVCDIVEAYNSSHSEQSIALAITCNPTEVRIPSIIHAVGTVIGASAIRYYDDVTTFTLRSEAPLEKAFNWPDGMAKKFRLGRRVAAYTSAVLTS